jgi:hypothetical protein
MRQCNAAPLIAFRKKRTDTTSGARGFARPLKMGFPDSGGLLSF